MSKWTGGGNGLRYHWQRYGSGEAENEDAKRSEREQNEQLGEGRVIER